MIATRPAAERETDLLRDYETYTNALRSGRDVRPVLAELESHHADWHLAGSRGHPQGMVLLGELIAQRVGHLDGFEIADSVRFFDESARLGLPDAMWLIGEAYYDGAGTPRDRKKAKRWYEAGSAVDHGPSVYSLGLMAAAGEAGPIDADLARHHFRRAAELGYPPAIVKCAKLLLETKHHADAVAGAELLHAAAKLRYPPAMVAYGAYLRRPLVGPPNDREAARWLHAAAEEGDPEALFAIGVMHRDGAAGPIDLAAAKEWFAKAAEAGHAEAAYQLGLLYRDGRKQNLEAAYHWFKTATDLGHKAAARAAYELE
jgi:uncharacterized protein